MLCAVVMSLFMRETSALQQSLKAYARSRQPSPFRATTIREHGPARYQRPQSSTPAVCPSMSCTISTPLLLTRLPPVFRESSRDTLTGPGSKTGREYSLLTLAVQVLVALSFQ